MPFIDHNGKTVSVKDLKELIAMMKGSYKSHIDEFTSLMEIREDARDLRYFIDAYQQRIDEIEQVYLDMAKSDQVYRIEDLINHEFEDTTKKAVLGHEKRILDAGGAALQVLSSLGEKTIVDLFEDSFRFQDRPESFENSTKSFKLAEKPMDGIKEIMDFNPNSDSIDAAKKQMMGNSNTLSWTDEKVAKEKQKLEQELHDGKISEEGYKNQLDKINNEVTERGKKIFQIDSGAEYTRVHASELINRNTVSAVDMINVFRSINSFVRMGDPAGGAPRGISVNAGNIYGIGSATIISKMYQTMQLIADYMNEIKAVKDPALQKTQALQLASFAYQVTISEHMFSDGNGRSCRLLADTILESFGLPPHSPVAEEIDISGTLGSPFNFDKGAEVFLKGVKASSDILKPIKEAELQKKGETLEEAAEKRFAGASGVLSNVSDEFVNDIAKLSNDALKARGTFRDSAQYKHFLATLDVNKSLAEAIQKAQASGKNEIEVKNLSTATKKLIQQLAGDNKTISISNAKGMLKQAHSSMVQAAKAYKDYKLKDYTLDPKGEPGKKPASNDTKLKLAIMERVLANDPQLKAEKSIQAVRNVETKNAVNKATNRFQKLKEARDAKSPQFWGLQEKDLEIANKKVNNPLKVHCDRNAAQTLAVSIMLGKNYSLEQVFSKNKEMAEVRKQCMQESLAMIKKGDPVEIGSTFGSGAVKVNEYLKPILQNMNNISTEEMLKPENRTVLLASGFLKDFNQEHEIVYRHMPEGDDKQRYSESYNKMQNETETYSNLLLRGTAGVMDLVNALDVGRKVFDADDVSKYLQGLAGQNYLNQIYNKQTENPQPLVGIMSEGKQIQKLNEVGLEIGDLPGYKDLKDRMKKDPAFSQKVVLSILNGSLEKDAKLSVNIAEDGTPTTTVDFKSIIKSIDARKYNMDIMKTKQQETINKLGPVKGEIDGFVIY